MARPRGDVIDPSVVGAYHCRTRCVRQLFLLKDDPKTLAENRSRWEFCENRLQFLAGIFAIDVLDFAFLSNHIHTSLRNRPDVVAAWNDDEIAHRWLTLHPSPAQKKEKRVEVIATDIKTLQQDTATLAKARRNLSCISYFQKNFLEPIAREMNLRDGKKGHFVAERFHCKRIEGEAALLTCSVYITLNPYRAGLGKSIDAHPFSSYARRCHRRITWVAPLSLDERAKSYGSVTDLRTAPDGSAQLHAAANKFGTPRCSNKGYLGLSWEDYQRICEWTADNCGPRATKSRPASGSAIPTDIAGMLSQAGVDTNYWVQSIERYAEIFHDFIATPNKMDEIARKLKQKYVKGKHACRSLHRQTAQEQSSSFG